MSKPRNSVGWLGALASLTLACGNAPSRVNSESSDTTAGVTTPATAPTTSEAPGSSSAVPSATSAQGASTGSESTAFIDTQGAETDATGQGASGDDGGSSEVPMTAPIGSVMPPTSSDPAPSASEATSDAFTSDEATSGEDAATGTTGVGSVCPHQGNITYTFNNAGSWPDDVAARLTTALDEAVYYYNCYADLTKALNINYNPDVPTAEGNVDGWISFGSDRNYMQTATAMHEVAHTLGVGYAPWSELIRDGRWVGPNVAQLMTNLPAQERDPDMYSQRTYITCDAQHFWPYGLNQASEHQSEWSLINHVRIVAAMNADKDAVR